MGKGARAAAVISMKDAMNMAIHLAGKGRTKHAALIAVCAGFGLRISDALALRWGAIFREHGKIRDRITITEHKTGRTRTVKALPWVRKLLTRYYQESRPLDLEEPMFDFTRQRAWQIIKKAANELGIAGNVAPHSLRKAFCDFVYEHTRDPVLTARITGHANPAQLLRYIGRLPEVEERVWERMASSLKHVDI